MMKQITYFSLLAALFLAQSCAKDGDNSQIISTDHTFTLSTKASSGESSELSNVNAYLFSAGKLVDILTDLPSPQFTIKMSKNTHIYFLAGLSTPPSSLSSLEVGKTSLETFLSLSCDPITAEQAPSATMFYTGEYSGSSKEVQKIMMTRSISRLDLETSSDPLTKITSITATGISLSSSIFGTTRPASTSRAEKVFKEPVSGTIEDVMQLFESSSPITLTVHGIYDTTPFVFDVILASAKRNTIYIIKLSGIGGSVTGSIGVKPWDTGDVVEGKPDVNSTISIDKERTTSDQGITIDETTNHITISESGGNLTLALSAQTPLSIASTQGVNPLITIGQPSSETVDNKIITKIEIAAAPQEQGRLPYQVRINLKSPLTENPYDFVTVDVEGNRDQIPTVQFCGYEIMAFNTTGSELSGQVYLTEGYSIEDMYINQWADCTGKMFQFGRLPGYYPNQTMVSKPNPQFLNWNDENTAPCPEGYEMPNSAEFRLLFPPNTSNVPLNGSVAIDYYIKGKLARLEMVVPDKRVTMGNLSNIVPRYFRITCDGQTLIFPIAGYKNSGNTASSIGEWFYVMAANRSDRTYTKVYGYSAPYWKNDNHSDKQQRMADNFNFIRCIKK